MWRKNIAGKPCLFIGADYNITAALRDCFGWTETGWPGVCTPGQPAKQYRQPEPVARIINLVDYFSSASMILLKVSDGRMTAVVFSSSGQ